MNHCHDCNSDYQTPGTCNCFAPGGKRDPAGVAIAPPATRTIPYPLPRDDSGSGDIPFVPLIRWGVLPCSTGTIRLSDNSLLPPAS